MLERLERSSSKFRNSLNAALVQRSVDQTQPQNDISTFQSDLDLAIKQFRDQFTHRPAVAADVESILQKASPINSLRVRRQIYSDRLTQPVVVDSVYNRTADVAEWNVYNDSRPVVGNTRATNGEFIVQDGETLVALLNNHLTTKQTKPGERFTMTVRQPGQYEDAVIEGTVSGMDQGGRLSGRSEMSLTFDTIRLRNGQTYRFAGILESVRTLNGNAIKVDNEGSAQGANRTTQTIQRAGIATAVGAVIGAIAGGGKGAAIGGIIGGAGGAGSVFILGKDNLALPSGTELTIRSSGPR